MLAVAHRIVEAQHDVIDGRMAHIGAAGLGRRRRAQHHPGRHHHQAHRAHHAAQRAASSDMKMSDTSISATTSTTALEGADFVSVRPPRSLPTPAPHRRRRAGAHEAHGHPRQHRPRPDRRPGRARRRPARGSPRRRGPRRHRPRAAARRPPASAGAQPAGRPPHRLGHHDRARRRWPTAPSTTCSPRSTASRCPIRCSRGDARSSVARACGSPSSTSARTPRACSSPTSPATGR